MTPLRFGFEPATLEGWLAFLRLPQRLAGRSVVVEYLPLPGRTPALAAPGAPTLADMAALARSEGLAWPANPHPAAAAEAARRLLQAAAPPGRGPSRHRCALLLEALWQYADRSDAARVLAQLRAALGLDDTLRPPAVDAVADLPDGAVPGRPWLQPVGGELAGQVFVGLAGQDALAVRLAMTSSAA